MRKLPTGVRLKAIEIANALLEEGYDEVSHCYRQGPLALFHPERLCLTLSAPSP
jgi:hypothetical protein